MPEAREESNIAPYDVITIFERRHAEGKQSRIRIIRVPGSMADSRRHVRAATRWQTR